MNDTVDAITEAGGLTTAGWAWEWWLVLSLVVALGSLIFSVIAVRLCNNRPCCFGSDPDPLRRAYLKCYGCDERGECLGLTANEAANHGH